MFRVLPLTWVSSVGIGSNLLNFPHKFIVFTFNDLLTWPVSRRQFNSNNGFIARFWIPCIRGHGQCRYLPPEARTRNNSGHKSQVIAAIRNIDSTYALTLDYMQITLLLLEQCTMCLHTGLYSVLYVRYIYPYIYPVRLKYWLA